MREDEERLLVELESLLGGTKLPRIPFPKPFCFDEKRVKAIVLGADPTNTKENTQFATVFGIGSGDGRYFRDILSNLKLVGLGLETVYVQNLCRNYFNEETSKNKLWEKAAKFWIPRLKDELVKIPADVPVLLTAEIIYKALMNPGQRIVGAAECYSGRATIPIRSETNGLNRPLIPFYRNPTYRLNDPRWDTYRRTLKQIFS